MFKISDDGLCFVSYAVLYCVVCGKSDLLRQPGLRDINYCSNACRQKAYRQRKANKK